MSEEQQGIPVYNYPTARKKVRADDNEDDCPIEGWLQGVSEETLREAVHAFIHVGLMSGDPDTQANTATLAGLLPGVDPKMKDYVLERTIGKSTLGMLEKLLED